MLSQDCSNFPASGGKLIEHGNIQISILGQAEGARNGGGGHHQQVGMFAFLEKPLTLQDPEFMLLIDHPNPQPPQIDPLLKEGMGSDK